MKNIYGFSQKLLLFGRVWKDGQNKGKFSQIMEAGGGSPSPLQSFKVTECFVEDTRGLETMDNMENIPNHELFLLTIIRLAGMIRGSS